MRQITKLLLATGVSAAAVTYATGAAAAVYVGIGLPGVVIAPPAYYAPPVAYAVPPPAYYAPVRAYGPGYYYGPAWGHRWHEWHEWHGHHHGGRRW